MRHVIPVNGGLPMSDTPPENNQSLPAFDFDRPDTPTPPPAPAFGQVPVKPNFVPVQGRKKQATGCLGILLFFGLAIGGCVAFAGFQTSGAIDDVRSNGHTYLDAVRAGDTSEAEALSINQRGCMSEDERSDAIAQLNGAVERDLREIDVVTVNGDNSFGWGDVEQLKLDFPDQSVARATGSLVLPDLTTIDTTLILLRPASQWRICQVTVG